MAEYIEIEGRVVRFLRHGSQDRMVVDREVPLAAFLQALMKWRGIPGPIEEATDLANLMYRV